MPSAAPLLCVVARAPQAIDKASDIASVFGDSGCIVRVLMAPVYNSQAREVGTHVQHERACETVRGRLQACMKSRPRDAMAEPTRTAMHAHATPRCVATRRFYL